VSRILADYEAIRAGCALLDRSARGKIEVAGTEAALFLHNICTNDIKKLPALSGCEAFWCNITAKVVAHGLVWRQPDEGKRQKFLLDLEPSLIAKLLGHLDRHLISEDAVLTDRTAERAQFHLVGRDAGRVLGTLGLLDDEMPPLTWREVGGITVRRVDALGVPGYDLLSADGPALRDRLVEAGARLVGDEAAEIVRVETGTPVYGIDFDETTFAPEVNRTAKAISYNKGCYLGQEPIVMARDRGVVQRLLLGLTFAGPVAVGSLLHRDGKEVGRVTSSVVSPTRGPIGLGYVRRGSQTPGTVLEAGETRVSATVTPVPMA
jgi:tRNA-modifying protein YgfZ